MTRFSDFNIEYTSKCMEGDRIDIERVFNQEITVSDYKIEDTKISGYKEKGADKCLYLQILYKGEYRIVFTSGKALMEAIEKIPKEKFPFTTIIIKDNKKYKFT